MLTYAALGVAGSAHGFIGVLGSITSVVKILACAESRERERERERERDQLIRIISNFFSGEEAKKTMRKKINHDTHRFRIDSVRDSLSRLCQQLR